MADTAVREGRNLPQRKEMSSKHLTILMLCFILASCGKPQDRFEFAYTPKNFSDTSAFRFEMTLDEPQTSYSTRVACRLDASAIRKNNIPLLITVSSPEGEDFSELVDFPVTASNGLVRTGKGAGPLVDIDWPYREKIVPGKDTGLWKVAIRPVDRSMIKNIYGMGWSYKAEN